MFKKFRSVLSNNLTHRFKTTILMTGVAFAPLMRTQAVCQTSIDQINEALELLENESSFTNTPSANTIQTNDSLVATNQRINQTEASVSSNTNVVDDFILKIKNKSLSDFSDLPNISTPVTNTQNVVTNETKTINKTFTNTQEIVTNGIDTAITYGQEPTTNTFKTINRVESDNIPSSSLTNNVDIPSVSSKNKEISNSIDIILKPSSSTKYTKKEPTSTIYNSENFIKPYLVGCFILMNALILVGIFSASKNKESRIQKLKRKIFKEEENSLLSAETLIEIMNIKTPPSKPTYTPSKDMKKLLDSWKTSEVPLLLQHQKEEKQKFSLNKANPIKKCMDKYPEDTVEDTPFVLDPSVSAKPQKDAISEIGTFTYDPNNEENSDSYLKGIEKLAQNKVKRAALTKHKRALKKELEAKDTPWERQIEIINQLEKLEEKSTKLREERREACALIKGKKGEEIKELRHKYAKRMKQLANLVKKEGYKREYMEEISKIAVLRQELTTAEKQLLAHSNTELKRRKKEREDKAKAAHGLRLLRDAKAKQAYLDVQIKQWKKETGYKKKEILEGNADLSDEAKQIKEFKKIAKRLLKDRFINQEKSDIRKEIALAISTKDIEKQNILEEKLKTLKEQEKNIFKQAQKSDYAANRISMLNEKVRKNIQEARKERERLEAEKKAEEKRIETIKKLKKERLEKANFLRAQRMLYQLQNGLVPAVNENRISADNYRKEAQKLLGNQTKKFDYPTLRSIYLFSKLGSKQRSI